ncbi:uncharacterized protein LOC119101600 [Pollicipes pollicipes]|uniref:uncharacterized protein LOC119101600 n=1 Tax=Pollicipes pollicipes TaxID=41117 RepID=UPI0018850751|nr:uncharacterized protein LOC119101600 [Pollicipes pollicipes]
MQTLSMVVFAVLAVAAAQYALPYGGLAYSVQPDASTYWTNLAAPYTNYASAIYKDIAANAPAGVRPQHDGLSTMFDGKVPVFPIEGSFSYVDLNGVKQTVDFTVDKSGFRVSGTNLPPAAVTDVKTPADAAATKSGYRK